MSKIKYSKSELEGVIKEVEKAENSDSMYIHSWARCAKILAAECVSLRAELEHRTNMENAEIEINLNLRKELDYIVEQNKIFLDGMNRYRDENERLTNQLSELNGLYVTGLDYIIELQNKLAVQTKAVDEAREAMSKNDMYKMGKWLIAHTTEIPDVQITCSNCGKYHTIYAPCPESEE